MMFIVAPDYDFSLRSRDMWIARVKRGVLAGAIAGFLVPTITSEAGLASPTVAPIIPALNYPTSSQRFFNEGNRQLEEEIQRLTQENPANATEPLHIDETLPAKLEQQRLQLEQPSGTVNRQS